MTSLAAQSRAFGFEGLGLVLSPSIILTMGLDLPPTIRLRKVEGRW